VPNNYSSTNTNFDPPNLSKDSTFKSMVPNPYSFGSSPALSKSLYPKAEFLDVIGTKAIVVFPSCYSQSPLRIRILLPTSPPSKSSLKLVVCDVNIVYGNLKCEKEFSRLCPETSTKLSVYEFGFRSDYTMTGFGSLSKLTQ
jgi:hypothetical protein